MAQQEDKKRKVILILIGITIAGTALYLLYRHNQKKNGTSQSDNPVLKDAYENLVFVTGTATINPSSFPSLDELATTLKQSPTWKLTISGHTDSTGTPKTNLVLSKKRADAVANYLTAAGVDPLRIQTQGFGQQQPIADNSTPEGREKNRRVEFLITK